VAEAFGVRKVKQPPPEDQLAVWREALQQDPAIAKAVIHVPDSSLREFRHGNTCLHLVADRFWDPPEPVQLAVILVDHGASLNAQNASGRTPLHFACNLETRDDALVELLLCRGADPNLKDSYGETPLHYAIGGSDVSKRIVALLLKHGANVDFDAAVRLGDVERVRRFLRQGGLSQSKRPRDLLTNAIYSDSAETVEALLEHGANPNQTPSFSPEPPLYTASSAIWGNVEIVRLLIKHGAEPNPKRYKPLAVAKRNKPNKPEIIELLLNAGAIKR
jgi:ankyrin repeat protein